MFLQIYDVFINIRSWNLGLINLSFQRLEKVEKFKEYSGLEKIRNVWID